MKTSLTIGVYFILTVSARQMVAQPYIDIAGARYVKSPDAGIVNHNGNKTILTYYNIGGNVPLPLNHKKDFLILSPCFENWQANLYNGDIPGGKETYTGLVFPVSWLKQLHNPLWSIQSTVIIRMNDRTIDNHGQWQVGGAILVAWKKSPVITWKAGLYVNGEYFGLFVVPLLGFDWKINPGTRLFGVLPGSATLEKKISPHFYGGGTYRSATNSFAKETRDVYWRINENQLGLYLDYYCNKNIVLTAEAGHSLFRRIRITQYANSGIEKINLHPNDNVYFKVGAAYRIRL